MWNTISSKEDLDSFISVFGGFHDSCLKEMKYNSGAYVANDLSMYPYNKERLLRLIFQRQYDNPAAIEMEVSGLIIMRLSLKDADLYTCEILGATMIMAEDRIYWCDCAGVSEEDLMNYEGILICGSQIRWRPLEERIGKGEVYK